MNNNKIDLTNPKAVTGIMYVAAAALTGIAALAWKAIYDVANS